MNKTERAFKWIIAIFQKHEIPFQLSGGFAAKLYGSPREVRDIDFDVPTERINELIPDIKDFIVFGPKKFLSDAFDIALLIRLDYFGQKIDIGGGSDSKTFDRKLDRWTEDKTGFSRFETKKIFGISVPVIKPEDLIEYKSKSPREEDLIDIEAVKKYLNL